MKFMETISIIKIPLTLHIFCLNYEKTEYLQSLSLLNTVFRKSTQVLKIKVCFENDSLLTLYYFLLTLYAAIFNSLLTVP